MTPRRDLGQITCCSSRCRQDPVRLGNDVWRQFILDPGDPILERKLLLFQPFECQRIGCTAFLQRRYGIIKIAMLALEDLKLDAQHLFMAQFRWRVHGFLHVQAGQSSATAWLRQRVPFQ